VSASVAVSGSGGGLLAALSRATDAAKLGGIGAVMGARAARSTGGPGGAGESGAFTKWLHNAARAQRRARVARNGDSGLHIARLQNLLNAKLVGVSPPLWVDGKFGRNTESRVRAFQGRNRLAADGLVGTKTSAVLDT
jgi:peptidoglycan hydrolase-like protein with peptidoglycan-binding domain